MKKKLNDKKPRVVIGNPAITEENIGEALSFLTNMGEKKPKRKKDKILSVAVSAWPGAIAVSWSAADVGFGEITYRFHEGKVEEDAEGMNDEFVQLVMEKVSELHKKNELKIILAQDLIPNLLSRLKTESRYNKKKRKR